MCVFSATQETVQQQSRITPIHTANQQTIPRYFHWRYIIGE